MSSRSAAAALGAFVAATAVRSGWVDPAARGADAERVAEDLLRSPGRDTLLVTSLEHALAWADLGWLAIVQMLSEGAKARPADWDRVERWAFLAVDLDPKYFTVYHAVATNLTVFARRSEVSDALLLRGRAELPSRWEFPFLLAYNAMMLRSDYAKAADWLDEASRLPRAPAHFRALAGRLRFHAGDRQGALSFLEEVMRELVPGSRIYREVSFRYVALQSEDVLTRFDAACERFRAERGRLPASGEELVAAGYERAPAVDGFGAPIVFKDTCVARTGRIKVREAEARAWLERRQEGNP